MCVTPPPPRLRALRTTLRSSTYTANHFGDKMPPRIDRPAAGIILAHAYIRFTDKIQTDSVCNRVRCVWKVDNFHLFQAPRNVQGMLRQDIVSSKTIDYLSFQMFQSN